ncbi:MAG: hypothetical protein H0T51_06960, partial [Pirellulales bacterium]|nr:hypothetical protein [Pirellulales bacterium]
MKTKGLVRRAALALALPLLLPSLGHAAEEVQLSSLLEEAESIEAEVYASDRVESSSYIEDRSVSRVAHHAAMANCRKSAFWFAGMETTLMNVNARSGGIITASFTDTTAPGVATSAFIDGNGVTDKFAYAPRIWGGRQFGERWAVVGRFWNLETSDQNSPPAANPAIPTVGTNFATIFETDRAHLRTADVELVRSFQPGKWKIDGTLGARHAHIGVDSDFLAFGVFTTGNFVNLTLQNGFNFSGEGGTSAIYVRRQIGNSP